jgi:hypothetical protein
MASDKKQFMAAMRHWRSLKNDGFESIDPSVGKTAVICSTSTVKSDCPKEEKVLRKDAKILRKEALKVAENRREAGYVADVIFQPTRLDIAQVLQDEMISDIIAIGHGTLTCFFLDLPDDDIYDWNDASFDADHLKTGYFVQRFCGGISDRIPVPLGMFVVSNFEDVIAPIDTDFNPKGLLHSENQKLQRPFEKIDPTYLAISRDMKSLAF